MSQTVRDLRDWWAFPKPKYNSWHLSVPNVGGGTGMRWGIRLAGLEEFDEAEAIANRIRDCLNGCAGINPDAVPDLLAACEGVVRRCESMGYVGVDGQFLKVVKAAIAKATDLPSPAPAEHPPVNH